MNAGDITFDRKSGNGVTMRQGQVLELVAKRCALKQIAAELSISESAVNQHIRALKLALGVNSLPELAQAYRAIDLPRDDVACRKPACRKSGLSLQPESEHLPVQDGMGPTLSFHEPMSIHIDAPWESLSEPAIVPEVLNGTNGKLARSAYVVAIALGLFVTILVGLGVAQGITAAWFSNGSPPSVQR
ncbi:MAG: LuxR C-terminal-related transcriptional regulator [Novosphingobium sp.]